VEIRSLGCETGGFEEACLKRVRQVQAPVRSSTSNVNNIEGAEKVPL